MTRESLSFRPSLLLYPALVAVAVGCSNGSSESFSSFDELKPAESDVAPLTSDLPIRDDEAMAAIGPTADEADAPSVTDTHDQADNANATDNHPDVVTADAVADKADGAAADDVELASAESDPDTTPQVATDNSASDNGGDELSAAARSVKAQREAAIQQYLKSLPPEIAQRMAEQQGLTIDNSEPTDVAPREIKLLIEDQAFRKEGPDDALRVSYDDMDLLKILNMDPVPKDAADHFPDWLKNLDGQRVRLRGFMYPTFLESGIENFTLARDNGICCFVRKPKIYDIVKITMRDGVTAEYIEGRPFDVVGVFQIAPEADEKELFRLYRINDAVIIE